MIVFSSNSLIIKYIYNESFLIPYTVKYQYQMSISMAPYSSTLAWKIPWTEEPGRLQSMRSLRAGHD